MIQVSKERVIELQMIIKEDYGRELNFAQVSSIAHDLVGYFDLLAKLYHEQKDDYENANGKK